jgi:hypothetical protein
MKLTTLMAALAVALTFAQAAQAREHHHRHAVSHQARRHLVAHRYAAMSPRNYGNYASAWASQNTAAAAFAWPAPSADHGVMRPYSTTRKPNYTQAWSYQETAAEAFAWPAQNSYRGGYGGRPRAWCGWEMRQLVGSDPGPQFNLARNWARWGQAGPPGVGAVVVWAHHVGKIVGQENGAWIIQSGNDGNRVRTRPLSIGRAIAIRWG